MESLIIVGFSVGILGILLIGKLIGIGISLLKKFVTNSVFAAIILIVANLFGMNIEVTIMRALLAGIFGVPGVIALIVWDKFLK